MIKDVYFTSNNLKLFGRLSLVENSKSFVVFLHGGGQSNSYRFEFIQDELSKNNISSFAFDFQGCGKSEGSFEDGSLLNRIKNAEDAVNYLIDNYQIASKDLYISGGSMGAHIACRILPKFNFKGIIIQAGAVYSLEAEKANLNYEFTKLITVDKNWIGSPAFNDLQKFKGRKIAIYGEFDDVIPQGVKNTYKKLVGDENYKVLTGGTHKLLVPDDKKQLNALNTLIEELVKFINITSI